MSPRPSLLLDHKGIHGSENGVSRGQAHCLAILYIPSRYPFPQRAYPTEVEAEWINQTFKVSKWSRGTFTLGRVSHSFEELECWGSKQSFKFFSGPWALAQGTTIFYLCISRGSPPKQTSGIYVLFCDGVMSSKSIIS